MEKQGKSVTRDHLWEGPASEEHEGIECLVRRKGIRFSKGEDSTDVKKKNEKGKVRHGEKAKGSSLTVVKKKGRDLWGNLKSGKNDQKIGACRRFEGVQKRRRREGKGGESK